MGILDALGFSSFAKYRRDVESGIGWLLFGLPDPQLSRLRCLFPGVDGAMRHAYGDGRSTDSVAANIVGTMVGSYFRAQPHEWRQSVIDAYLDRSGSMAERDPEVMLWQTTLQIMEGNAEMMLKGGRLDEFTVDWLIEEVVGALRGFTSEEISRHRIARSLERNMFGNMVDPEQ
jgi:hypothetical protein